MKLIVRKLWFRHNLEAVMAALFQIPQLQEQFDGGYLYAGEMRPRGIKICPGYWPADAILERLPSFDRDVGLVLTSMDLKGMYGRINGKGRCRKTIASNCGYIEGSGVFQPKSVDFNAVTFGEIGHALGLEHHEFDHRNPCEMSHNYIPGPDWARLAEIRFCEDCYKKLKH